MDIDLAVLKAKVVEEVNLLPGERLVDLYNLLLYFRLGVENSPQAKQVNAAKIMALAGSWADLPEGDFAELLDEISQRRQLAFTRRRTNASSPD